MDSLKNLILTFTNNLKIFFITWVVSFLILAGISFIIPEIYKSEMTLVTSEDSKGEFQSLGSAGALASLAGISLDSEVSRSQIALAKIRSKSFFIEVINNHADQILPGLVAAKSYNKRDKEIIYNEKIYSNGVWYGNKDYDIFEKVFIEEAYLKYLKNLRVNENRLTRLITVSYDHVSPAFAYEILRIILDQINKSERNTDQMEAEYAIDFINSSLGRYSNEEVRRSASDLLERQLVTLMVTKSKKYYLLEPIDGPHIPAKRNFPSRTMIVLVGEIIISMILFLWLYYRQELKVLFASIEVESK